MAVVVTYLTPVAGITAPTTAQASQADTVVADIVASADADVTATVTHNMQISAADLAAGFPLVSIIPTLSQALAALSSWSVTTIATNTVVLTKLATAGSGNAAAQLRVTVLRPWAPTK